MSRRRKPSKQEIDFLLEEASGLADRMSVIATARVKPGSIEAAHLLMDFRYTDMQKMCKMMRNLILAIEPDRFKRHGQMQKTPEV